MLPTDSKPCGKQTACALLRCCALGQFR